MVAGGEVTTILNTTDVNATATPIPAEDEAEETEEGLILDEQSLGEECGPVVCDPGLECCNE